jgi:hypothetical protein
MLTCGSIYNKISGFLVAGDELVDDSPCFPGRALTLGCLDTSCGLPISAYHIAVVRGSVRSSSEPVPKDKTHRRFGVNLAV